MWKPRMHPIFANVFSLEIDSAKESCVSGETRKTKSAMGLGVGLAKCIVRGCNDKTSRRIRIPHPLYDTYKRFGKWLRLADNPELDIMDEMDIYKSKRICEKHFSPECFVVCTNRLKRNALPNKNLPELEIALSREPGPSGLQMPVRGASPPAELEIPLSPEPGPSGLQMPVRGASPPAVAGDPPHPPRARRALFRGQKMEGVLRHIGVRTATELTPKAKFLYKTTKQLQRNLRYSSSNLVSFRKRLRAANKTFDVCSGGFLEGLPRTLATFLQCQIKETSRKGKGHRFSLDFKVWALSLLKRSGRAYNFLSKCFVLPSRRTLLRLLSRLSFLTGINNDMFDHLSVTVKKTVKDIDRHCILMFDEMSLSPQLTFLEHLDFIEGFEDLGGGDRAPRFADKALVFMVRGLRRSYKQPVAYAFPSGTVKTPDLCRLLKEVISKLTSTGLKVCATVCDQGSTNVASITRLCAETRESVLRSGGEYMGDYFCVDGVKVIPLYDPPHLLKGIRNGLLSKDLKFCLRGENKTASWRHVLQFYAKDCWEDRSVPSLTDLHVIPEKIKKMKVIYCTQVFSQRLSSSMGLLASNNVSGLDPKAVETAQLLKFFDTVFDSVNGRCQQPPPNKPLRCAVRSSSGHMEFWAEAIKVFESMVYTDGVKESKSPSIKNWGRTLRNIRALWLQLRSKGFKYLSPRNLNQDPLENKFGSIRSYGFRNNNPTCTNFVGAYKALLLNDMVAAHSVGANCEEDDCEVLDNLRCYLMTSRPSSTSPSSLPGGIPIVSGDDDSEPPEETRSPSEWSSTMEFSARSAADMLLKLGPIHCPECSHKHYNRPHHTPSADFINIYKQSIDLIHRHLPSTCFKLGVGAHLKNKLKSTLNMSLFACDNHLTTYGTNFCNIVVTNTLIAWCNSVNRYLKGKHTEHTEQMDNIHKMAYDYFSRRRHIR